MEAFHKESNYWIPVKRLVAFIVELGLSFLLAQILFYLYSIFNFSFADQLRSLDLIWILYFLISTISIISMRTTPGDVLMKIRIKELSFKNPSKLRLIVRNTFLVGYLAVAGENSFYFIIMMLFFFSSLISLTPKRFQLIHDSIFRTIVVKEP